jgi:heme-degrading monooxygenase HmoA
MILVVTYRLRTNADESAFIALDAQLQTDFYYQQPGIERRTTARSTDGAWVTISHWDSTDAIAAARSAAVAEGVMAKLGEYIDMSTITGTTYAPL